MFENIQRGVYQVGEKSYYFRSKWEYEYACYLEWLKNKKQIYDWKYEPKTFEFPIKHGTTRYIPDFQVFNTKDKWGWHEVKGYLTGKANTQIKRFKKYYPKEKHILIDGEWFKTSKKMSKLWLNL